MRPHSFGRYCTAIASAIAVAALIGCSGSKGDTGAKGDPGTPAPVSGYVRDAAAMTDAEWQALNPKGAITSASVTNGVPVVNFTLTDPNGNGIKGLGNFDMKVPGTDLVHSYPNFYFEFAKLVPPAAGVGGPSKWVSYIVNTVAKVGVDSKPQAPNAETNGTLADHGDGTYTYTFYNNIGQAAAIVAAYGTANSLDMSDLGDLSYQPNLVHRVSIEFYGYKRGTGAGFTSDRHTNTADGSAGAPVVEIENAANLTYDFIPATGKAATATDTSREIVALQTCNTCHTVLKYHGDHRLDPKNCVTCHTDQRKYKTTEATRTQDATTGVWSFTSSAARVNNTAELDFPQLIHQIHMGEALQTQNYDLQPDSTLSEYAHGGIPINKITYPQSVANCATCHTQVTGTDGTTVLNPLAGNWKTVPSREACGACHDTTQFLEGINHVPTSTFKVTDDTTCTQCHHADDIATYHTPVIGPDLTNGGIPASLGGVSSNTHTNASFVSGDRSNLPAGAANVTWNLKSVTVDASNHPVFVFNFMVNGTAAVFNTPGAKTEMMDGFAGSPWLAVAIGFTQDGIASNDISTSTTINLHKIWRGAQSGATLTGPDSNGYYTATLGNVVVPSSATLVVGGIGYGYGVAANTATAAAAGDALQLTQINLPAYPWGSQVINGTTQTINYQGGFTVPAPNVWMNATKSDGVTLYGTRRNIVAQDRCDACHKNLGTFTESQFHDGQRNDAATCVFCHYENRTGNGGNAINTKEIIHSIHASAKRANPFTWEGGYWDVTYPAVLNNCEACHLPGTYDLSATSSYLPNMQWTTVAGGTVVSGSHLASPGDFVAGTTYISPYVTSGQNYGPLTAANLGTASGTAYSWDVAGTPVSITPASGATYEADPATLVSSPISAACYSCHDTATAKLHISQNGGQIAVTRKVAYGSNPAPVAGAPVALGKGLVNTETCLVCHGSGKTADIKAVHMTF